MMNTLAKFRFHDAVSMDEVHATLRLAVLAIQSVHGEERVRLEAPIQVDAQARTCVIDATRRVGRTLALVFAGYVRREFGGHMVHFEWEPAQREGAPGRCH